ncbi:MAG: hypothetical protein R3B84_11630 [Zavarzinella sp.]
MRCCLLLLLMCGILSGREPVKRKLDATYTDKLELLLLTDQPQIITLKVENQGKQISAIWAETFASIFQYFDYSGDGLLNKVEAAHLPSEFAIRQVLWGQLNPYFGAAPAFSELDCTKDGLVSPQELENYYRRAGLGGVLVGIGIAPDTQRLSDALIKSLDTNHDTIVDRSEWDQAATLLATLDKNGDELIGPGELVERAVYPGATGTILLSAPKPTSKQSATIDQFPLMVLPSRLDDIYWQTTLKVRRNAAKQIQCDSTTIRYTKPAVAWEVSLSDPVSHTKVRKYTHSDITIDLRMDAGKLALQTRDSRQRLIGEYSERDTNSDGTLDTNELMVPKASLFQQLLAISDKDKNNQLSNAEFEAWFKVQQQIARSHVLVTIIDHGKGLFSYLDTNQDGSLSLRELRVAKSHFEQKKMIVNNTLDQSKIPHQLLATVSHGHPLSAIGKPHLEAPDWFLAMDRNSDGDISRKEWIGEPKLFLSLDTDKDQLLSVSEAAKLAIKK